MRIAIILFVILISTHLNAQSILSLPGSSGDSSKTKNAFIIIKGDEIRRFPSPNFMDAVNGLFPWVFSPELNQNDYLFIINGFIYPDVNSISLNDIEEIMFTRDNLYGSLFHFSKRGTFLITTKTPMDRKIKINFNSQYNTSWNNERSLTPATFGFTGQPPAKVDDRDNKNGHYLDNHLSLSWAGKKLNVYFSAAINDQQLPRINQRIIFNSGDTINGTYKASYSTQRLFLNLGYRFSKKIEAGISADYSHNRFKDQLDFDRSNPYSLGTTHAKSQAPLNYYHVAAFINYKIVKNLTNIFWSEYLFEKADADDKTISNYTNYGNPPVELTGTTNTKAFTKKLIIRDQLQYKLFPQSKFTGDISFTTAYIRRHPSYETFSQSYQNGGLWQESRSWFSFKEKIATLNPMFNFSYRQYISGYVGASFLVGKKVFKNVQDKDKKGIYSGLELSLTPLLKNNKVITSLSLSSSYSDLPENNSTDYWLNRSFLSNGLGVSGILTVNGLNINSNELRLDRNKLLVIALNAGMVNNRLRFIAQWNQLKSEELYLVRVSSFPPFSIYVPGKVTTEAFSFALAAKIIDKSKAKWQSRLNLLFPETKLDQIGTLSGSTPYRSNMRAALQNSVDYNRLFIQLNATLDLGHVYYPPNVYPQTQEKHNDGCLNYVLLGYRVPVSKPARIDNISVFIQARNLFSSERLRTLYEYDHYAGVGVNLGF